MSTIWMSAYTQVRTPTPRSLKMKFGPRTVVAPRLWKIHTTRPKNSVSPSSTPRRYARRSEVSQSCRFDASSEGPSPAIGGTIQPLPMNYQLEYMAGAQTRLCPWNSRPDENDAADRRSFLRVELRRNARRALVDLDALDVLRDYVVDVQGVRLHTIDPVLGRTIATPHRAIESERCLAPVAHRYETRARDRSHHIAQVHGIALFNLFAGHEVAKAA